MQPLKTLKPFKLTWPLRKQPSNPGMLLVHLPRKKVRNPLLKKKGFDWIIFFQVPQLE